MEDKELIEILKDQITELQTLQKGIRNIKDVSSEEKIKLILALSRQLTENIEGIYTIEHGITEEKEDNDRNNETAITEDREKKEIKKLKFLLIKMGFVRKSEQLIKSK